MEINYQDGRLIQIVVVEDNSDDALMTLRALKKLKPAPVVKLVRDGQEALKELLGVSASRPDVVFLDLKLPKVHGLEVLRTLREDPDAKSIPVVVLTSSDDPSDIARATELGANEYIRKPIDWEEYATQLVQAAERYIKSFACKG